MYRRYTHFEACVWLSDRVEVEVWGRLRGVDLQDAKRCGKSRLCTLSSTVVATIFTLDLGSGDRVMHGTHACSTAALAPDQFPRRPGRAANPSGNTPCALLGAA